MTLPTANGALTRRKGLTFLAGGCGLFLFQEAAFAGRQVEEPISDVVKFALNAAIRTPDVPEPKFRDTESLLLYARWKVEMSKRLLHRKSDLRTVKERDDFLQTVWYWCKFNRLDTDLVLGLIQVESAFRRYAISSVGARGYMQVMPFWMRAIPGGDVTTLFHTGINIPFGCVILREYLEREKGDLYMALGRYNGSRGKPQYPNAVNAARKRWGYKDKP
jgi:soluble lytic murein transglycosylase-like protein